MQPLNRSKPIQPIDLTVQSPISSATTNSILTGAYNVLNNVNPVIKTNNNNNTTNSNTAPQVQYNKNNNNNNTKRTQPKPSKPQCFTSGIVDYVSFNYDANRLKHSDYHNHFGDKFGEEISRIIASEQQNNNNSKIKSKPFDPYKILSAPPIKSENQNINETIIDYSKYNLFGTDTAKQSIVYKLFHPSFDHGIKDTNLFNYIATNILQLKCVGDIGIDILNFLHSLFIILYWNDRYFKLQLNEVPMHGIIKMLQDLVPLQTCVWWLNLHHSLNQINQNQNLPNIDFKNILNKQTEKNIFYSNLIKRLMSSGEQQTNTWKDYLFHSQSNLNTFLFDEKKRRLNQINDHNNISFNKQLHNYIDQLLLPKLILNCKEICDKLQQKLIISQQLSLQCLKSRKYLAQKLPSYFSDHNKDNSSNSSSDDESMDEQDDDVILIDKDDAKDTALLDKFDMNIQESFTKYEELQKQAHKDRQRSQSHSPHEHKRKKKRKKRKKKYKRRRSSKDDETVSTVVTSSDSDQETMSEDYSEQHKKRGRKKKRKRDREVTSSGDDGDLDRKRKRKNDTQDVIVPRKKQKRMKHKVVNKKSKSDSNILMPSCMDVKLPIDGKICIDFDRRQVDSFLNCGICKKCLGSDVLTINECMDSFCRQCLDEYLDKCGKDNDGVRCPSCKHDLGQGSISSIRDKMCKEDKMKMSLIELIKNAKSTNISEVTGVTA